MASTAVAPNVKNPPNSDVKTVGIKSQKCSQLKILISDFISAATA